VVSRIVIATAATPAGPCLSHGGTARDERVADDGRTDKLLVRRLVEAVNPGV
jgi:hypothetical protein